MYRQRKNVVVGALWFLTSKKDEEQTSSEIALQQRLEKFDASDSTSSWERVRHTFFTKDEYGIRSPIVSNILQTTACASFFGGMYGGYLKSQVAYLDFMRTNQATKFLSHLDAKKHLQDRIFLGFIKGGMQLAWRAGLFTFVFMTLSNVIALYRNKDGILEYSAGGAAAGISYRIHLGLRGMIVGGILGLSLGTIGGVCTFSLLKVCGVTMTDVRDASYQFSLAQQRACQKAYDKAEREEATEMSDSQEMLKKIVQDEASQRIQDNLEAIEKKKS